MSVNLSVNVPDELADRLRRRAANNRRSLQWELLIILEAAAGHDARSSAVDAPSDRAPRDALAIEQLAELSRALFPRGTQSSVAYIRQLRNSR